MPNAGQISTEIFLAQREETMTCPNLCERSLAGGFAESDYIDDHTQYAPAWNISTAPPTFEEFEAGVNMGRNEKGVNREQIPGELWKHNA